MDRTRLANCIFLCLLVLCSSVPYAFLNTPAIADDQSDWELVLDDAQRPVRLAAFGSTYADQYIRLSLLTPPIELEDVVGFGPAGEPITWTTAYLGPEMFSEATATELTSNQIQQLDPISAQAHLAVGTLNGPSGSVNMVGMYMSTTDADGIQQNHLLPVGEASAELIDLLTEMTAVVLQVPISAASRSPCDSPTHCHDLYRTRIAKALRDFAKCMKDLVPPFSLCAVACFILCVPFGPGDPLYLACVAGCVAGCTGIGIIEWQTCEDPLEFAKFDAVSSYCLCIAWKEANCQPIDWEIDIVGCDDDDPNDEPEAP